MIKLTTTQAKAYANFTNAVIKSKRDDEYTVELYSGSVGYEILDLQGKTKIYKSVSTAAQFAKASGVQTAQIIF